MAGKAADLSKQFVCISETPRINSQTSLSHCTRNFIACVQHWTTPFLVRAGTNGILHEMLDIACSVWKKEPLLDWNHVYFSTPQQQFFDQTYIPHAAAFSVGAGQRGYCEWQSLGALWPFERTQSRRFLGPRSPHCDAFVATDRLKDLLISIWDSTTCVLHIVCLEVSSYSFLSNLELFWHQLWLGMDLQDHILLDDLMLAPLVTSTFPFSRCRWIGQASRVPMAPPMLQTPSPWSSTVDSGKLPNCTPRRRSSWKTCHPWRPVLIRSTSIYRIW